MGYYGAYTGDVVTCRPGLLIPPTGVPTLPPTPAPPPPTGKPGEPGPPGDMVSTVPNDATLNRQFSAFTILRLFVKPKTKIHIQSRFVYFEKVKH